MLKLNMEKILKTTSAVVLSLALSSNIALQGFAENAENTEGITEKKIVSYVPAVPKISSAELNYDGTAEIKIDYFFTYGISGYKILYSSDVDFSHPAVKIVKDSNAKKFTLNNLNIDKKYYIKILAFKTANNKTYKSKYSSVKSLKVKPLKTNSNAKVTDKKAFIYWKKTNDAEKYKIYRSNSLSEWKSISSVKSNNFTDNSLNSDTIYFYKIVTYKKGKPVKTAIIKVKTARTVFITVKNNNTVCYNKTTKKKSSVSLEKGTYTGYSLNAYPKKYIVYAKYGEFLVDKSLCTVSYPKNGKILSTPCVSQLCGEKYTGMACGPVSAVMLLRGECNVPVTKEKILSVFRKKTYKKFISGGTPPFTLKKLINNMLKKYGVNNKKAVTVTVADKNRSQLKSRIISLLNNNKRVIVCVSHKISDSKTSKTQNGQVVNYVNYKTSSHWIVITGYKVTNGQTYFYYANPWHSKSHKTYDYASRHSWYNAPQYKNCYYGVQKVKSGVLLSSMKIGAADCNAFLYLK